jgi:hypothetical protein
VTSITIRRDFIHIAPKRHVAAKLVISTQNPVNERNRDISKLRFPPDFLCAKVLSHVSNPLQTPFDSVENAQQYVRLLVEAIAEARNEIAADLDATVTVKPDRRVEALRVVQFKLDKLEQHLRTSSRLLNDLRTLRRLLFDERPEATAAGQDPAA